MAPPPPAAALDSGLDETSAAMTAFRQYDVDKDGLLNLREFAAFVKATNEEVGLLDANNMPVYIKQAHRQADVDSDGFVTPRDFADWHARFVVEIARFEAEQAAKRAAKAAAAAALVDQPRASAQPSAFQGEGVWECKMGALGAALEAAYALKRTPLLIDSTGRADGGASPLETFYSYSGHQLLELKKMVVEVNMKKTVSLDEALEAARSKLVLAMKRGYSLVLMCANSAPPLRSKFCHPAKLPIELFDQTLVQATRGGDGNIEGSFLAGVRTPDDQLYVVHDEFNVLAVTRFSRDDYAEFLMDEMPLELMQPIVVTLDA